MVNYEEEDDILIETESEDSDFVEEHGEHVTFVVQKYSTIKRSPTQCNDTKFYIQGVQSRIRCAILSLTMGAAKILCQRRSWII